MTIDLRKTAACGLIFFLAAGYLSGDWRSDVASYLSGDKDLNGAVDYIRNIYDTLDEEYAPTLCALLAFVHSRLGHQEPEKKWIVRLFEKYRGMSTVFNFLDYQTQASIAAFLGRWHQVYPLITDLFLVEQNNSSTFTPPASIVIGVEITNPAYYKIVKNDQIILGSMFHKGFNILRIDASSLFSQPGIHVYHLQLKKGELELTREIRMDVDVSSPQFRTSPQAETKKIEYTLSLFVEDDMISSVRKIERLQTPLKLGFSNNALKGGKFDPLHRADPQGHPDPLSNSVNIPAVVAGVASLIKDLFGKNDEQTQEPQIRKSMEQEFRYFRRLYGMDQETRAKVTLVTRSLDLSDEGG
jgi:hypothetical protein